MTREEAIARLKEIDIRDALQEDYDALYVAIEALEQKPTTKIEESNFSQEQYLTDIQSAYDCGKSVIDKIRAEIEKLTYYWCEVNPRTVIDDVLAIINKYNAESEEKKI